MDTEKIFACMRERGIREWLVRKVKEIYATTKSKVKVGEKEGEWCETIKGVRQGERDRDTDKQERRERIRESKTIGSMRGCSGIPGERARKREK
jgi:hypothetical protein